MSTIDFHLIENTIFAYLRDPEQTASVLDQYFFGNPGNMNELQKSIDPLKHNKSIKDFVKSVLLKNNIISEDNITDSVIKEFLEQAKQYDKGSYIAFMDWLKVKYPDMNPYSIWCLFGTQI